MEKLKNNTKYLIIALAVLLTVAIAVSLSMIRTTAAGSSPVVTVYVDGTNGNDSSGEIGNQSAAFKTTEGALLALKSYYANITDDAKDCKATIEILGDCNAAASYSKLQAVFGSNYVLVCNSGGTLIGKIYVHGNSHKLTTKFDASNSKSLENNYEITDLDINFVSDSATSTVQVMIGAQDGYANGVNKLPTNVVIGRAPTEEQVKNDDVPEDVSFFANGNSVSVYLYGTRPNDASNGKTGRSVSLTLNSGKYRRPYLCGTANSDAAGVGTANVPFVFNLTVGGKVQITEAIQGLSNQKLYFANAEINITIKDRAVVNGVYATYASGGDTTKDYNDKVSVNIKLKDYCNNKAWTVGFYRTKFKTQTFTGNSSIEVDPTATFSNNLMLARGDTDNDKRIKVVGNLEMIYNDPDATFDASFLSTYVPKIWAVNLQGKEVSTFKAGTFENIYSPQSSLWYYTRQDKINNFEGGIFKGTIVAAPASNPGIENNIYGGADFSKAMFCGGLTNPGSTISGNITNNVLADKNGNFPTFVQFNGAGLEGVITGTVTNNIYGGTFTGNNDSDVNINNHADRSFYGGFAVTKDRLSSDFSTSKCKIGNIVNNIYGGTFSQYFCGASEAGLVTNSVKNTIYGGTFNAKFAGGMGTQRTTYQTNTYLYVNASKIGTTVSLNNVETKVHGGTFNDQFYGACGVSTSNVSVVGNTYVEVSPYTLPGEDAPIPEPVFGSTFATCYDNPNQRDKVKIECGIFNGVVYGSTNSDTKSSLSGNTTISGGTFNNTVYALGRRNGGGGAGLTASISGGAFNGTVYIFYSNTSTTNPTISISGGTFETNFYLYREANTTSTANTTVSGGTFKKVCTLGAVNSSRCNLNTTIKGGTFNSYVVGGSYSNKITGDITNNLEGNISINSFYGATVKGSIEGNVTNNIKSNESGTPRINTAFYGVASGESGTFGIQSGANKEVTNNIYAGTFGGHFYGSNGYTNDTDISVATSVENNIYGGTFAKDKDFCGATKKGKVGSATTTIYCGDSDIIFNRTFYGGSNGNGVVTGALKVEIKDDDEATIHKEPIFNEQFYAGSSNGSIAAITCTVNRGNFVKEVYFGNGDAGFDTSNMASITATVNGGTFNAVAYLSARKGYISGNVDVFVTGGTFKSAVYCGGRFVKVGGTQTNEISGGTFDGNFNFGMETNSPSNNVIYSEVEIPALKNTISGGTFESSVSFASGVCANTTSLTNDISGGNFKGDLRLGGYKEERVNVTNTITGGTFERTVYGSGSVMSSGSVTNIISNVTIPYFIGFNSSAATFTGNITNTASNCIFSNDFGVASGSKVTGTIKNTFKDCTFNGNINFYDIGVDIDCDIYGGSFKGFWSSDDATCKVNINLHLDPAEGETDGKDITFLGGGNIGCTCQEKANVIKNIIVSGGASDGILILNNVNNNCLSVSSIKVKDGGTNKLKVKAGAEYGWTNELNYLKVADKSLGEIEDKTDTSLCKLWANNDKNVLVAYTDKGASSLVLGSSFIYENYLTKPFINAMNTVHHGYKVIISKGDKTYELTYNASNGSFTEGTNNFAGTYETLDAGAYGLIAKVFLPAVEFKGDLNVEVLTPDGETVVNVSESVGDVLDRVKDAYPEIEEEVNAATATTLSFCEAAKNYFDKEVGSMEATTEENNLFDSYASNTKKVSAIYSGDGHFSGNNSAAYQIIGTSLKFTDSISIKFWMKAPKDADMSGIDAYVQLQGDDEYEKFDGEIIKNGSYYTVEYVFAQQDIAKDVSIVLKNANGVVSNTYVDNVISYCLAVPDAYPSDIKLNVFARKVLSYIHYTEIMFEAL